MNSTESRRFRFSYGLYGLAAMGLLLGAIVVWRAFQRPVIRQVDRRDNDASTDSQIVAKPKPMLPRSDFAGSAACTECHRDIAQAYQSHSMASSLWEAASAPEIEDLSKGNSFSPDDRHWYSVEKTAEGVFHHERLIDPEGETLYDQSVQVDFVIGSGHQGRSYLIQRGGMLFMSPITWYSHAAKWDLSPQYKLPTHRRFGRRINDGCVNCHAGRVNEIRGTSERYGTPPFYELAIGCERCHGPGAEHIQFRRGGPGQPGDDPIVNPAKLDPACREDICAQCHLQGEGTYARHGYEIGDFRPGQRLEETCVIFVEGTRMTSQGTTKAVSQVEQMRASRCFQKSEGKFGCCSCHDPHSKPREAELVAVYRKKCLACHEHQACRLPEAERMTLQSDDSCIACHMPKLGASDVPHTSQTDHRVLKRPTQDLPANSTGLPDIYDNAETRLPRAAVDYARGLWLAENAEKKTDRTLAARAIPLLTGALKEFPDDTRILNGLGTASAVSGRFEDSLNYWKKSLAIDPDGEQTLEMLMITLHNNGRQGEAKTYLERLLKLNPYKATLWGRYAGLLSRDGEWNGAIEAAKKSMELDPSVLQTYQFLADAYRRTGDAEKSRYYSDKFEKIQKLRR